MFAKPHIEYHYYKVAKNKILLNNKKFLSKEQGFYGRKEELSKLLFALNNASGSTVLISGDRGSGKTRLIDEAVKQLKHELRGQFSLREPELFGKAIISFLKLKTDPVIIKVPLVPSDTDSAMLRGVVLRAIIYALAAERPFRRYFSRPVTYRWRLSALKRMISYKRIIKETSFGANAASNLQGGFSLGSVYKSELDLSDIRIEIALANFFKRYSKTQKFVIIFDETDKYEEEEEREQSKNTSPKLTPEQLIYQTKNLFTTQGAHFIFVSTEDYYYRLQGKILSNTRGTAHTLFTNTILINHMSPDGFEKSLSEKISNHEDIKDEAWYTQFMQAMMWSSNLYPFEQNKQLSELTQSDRLTIELNDVKSYYSDYWDGYAAMHWLVSDIYKKLSSLRDTYYNRYLYRALREIAMFLFQSDRIEGINRLNLIALVFYNDVFEDREDMPSNRAEFLSHPLSRSSQPALQDVSWKNRIYELSAQDLQKVEDAVEDLLWRLDRLGLISISQTENWNDPIVITTKLRAMSFSELIDKSVDINVHTKKEKRMLREYTLLYSQYSNIKRELSDIGPVKIAMGDKPYAELTNKSSGFSSDIDMALQQMEGARLAVKYPLQKSIYNWVNESHSTSISSNDFNDETGELVLSNGEKVLHMKSDISQSEIDQYLSDKHKIIAIFTYKSTYGKAVKRSSFLKKILLPKDYSGFTRAQYEVKHVVINYFNLAHAS